MEDLSTTVDYHSVCVYFQVMNLSYCSTYASLNTVRFGSLPTVQYTILYHTSIRMRRGKSIASCILVFLALKYVYIREIFLLGLLRTTITQNSEYMIAIEINLFRDLFSLYPAQDRLALADMLMYKRIISFAIQDKPLRPPVARGSCITARLKSYISFFLLGWAVICALLTHRFIK